MRRACLLPLSLLVFSLGGCASMAGTVRAQAATEFPCPKGSVSVQQIDANTFEATGCGSRATYDCGRQFATASHASFSCVRKTSQDR